MTTPDPISAATTTPAPPPPEATTVEETTEIEQFVQKWSGGLPVPQEELRNIILSVAGLEPADLLQMPMIDRVDWGGTKWQVNQSPPGGAMNDFYVACMFIGDQYDKQGDYVSGDARVYVAPQKPDGANFYCYTISRVPNTGVVRARMGMAMFIEAVSDELEKLAIAFDVLEEDEEPEEEEEEEEEETE